LIIDHDCGGVEQVGVGGIGEVYRARGTIRERTVAIKVIKL
jgi:serine/threonine protein kinase